MAPVFYEIKLFQEATNKRLILVKESSTSPRVTSISIKPESNFSADTDLELKCRICLKAGTIPIFPEDGSVETQRAIETFADIPVYEDDDFPRYLCDICNSVLRSAISFRETAKKSFNLLNKMKKLKKEVKHELRPKTEIKILPESEDEFDSKNEDYPDSKSEDEHDLKNLSQNTKKTKQQDSILNKYFDHVEINNSGDIVKYDPTNRKLPNAKVQCKICSKVIAKTYYARHFTLRHDPKTHICDVCGKSFRLKAFLTAHMTTHSVDFPYKCQFCPYKGKHSSLLKSHMKVHNQDYKYKCTYCPAQYLNKSNLNNHMFKHTEPKFPCSTCNKSFHTQTLLDRHIEVDHLGIKKHVCGECGKGFGYKKGLNKHQIQVHKREKREQGGTSTAS